MISVYTARGMLIESVDAVWLYGTASEHAVFYQYNFNAARNVFAGMLQTESPYYQPSPAPPAPYKANVGVFRGDPKYNCGNDFDGCDESWAVMIVGSQNIYVCSAGIYSWFSTYAQTCSKQPQLPASGVTNQASSRRSHVPEGFDLHEQELSPCASPAGGNHRREVLACSRRQGCIGDGQLGHRRPSGCKLWQDHEVLENAVADQPASGLKFQSLTRRRLATRTSSTTATSRPTCRRAPTTNTRPWKILMPP